MNIYVGNLSADVSDEDLKGAFEAFGKVDEAKVVTDKFSGTSRGFGFVEMPEQSEAQAALEGMNGTDLKGKILIVNEARARSDKGRERGGGGGGGGRGGRRGGGGGNRY